MCVLQENNVPLPISEVRLYQEWLNLLTGVYDVYKEVKRIKSDRQHLVLLARKIAFRLHLKGMREENYENLLARISHEVRKNVGTSVV